MMSLIEGTRTIGHKKSFDMVDMNLHLRDARVFDNGTTCGHESATS